MSDDSLEQRLRRLFAANDNVPPRPEPTYHYRVELRYEAPEVEGTPERALATTIAVRIGPMTETAFDDCSDAQIVAHAIAALPEAYQALVTSWPLESIKVLDFDQLDEANEDAIAAWDAEYDDDDADDDDADDDPDHDYDYDYVDDDENEGGW